MAPQLTSWSAGGEASKVAALLAGIRARDASILGITDLDLTGCGLEELPTEVCELTRLEKLNLGGNNLADLPDAFSALVSLRILFFLGNAFRAIPAVIGRLPALETVSFKSCQLAAVGEDCLPTSLRALILTSNAITSLPTTVGSAAGAGGRGHFVEQRP